MNRFLKFSLLAACSFVFIQLAAQTNFSKGVNLTGWFQVDNARQIQFTKYTKEDLIHIKSLGCDVIRLPINLHYMTNGAPDYVIDPLFFEFMDQVVDWAEELQINLLLDNHSFDPNVDTQPSIEGILLKVWPQMAEHYKNRSNYIYYEVLNEPHGISTVAWCQIQQHVIDAIRAIDTKHTIVVGPSGFNSYNELQNMPVYTDMNLIYTFHFYDPFMFTHQGATWTGFMQDLAGVPFPYVASQMPATPASAKGSWVESSLINYKNDGTVAQVKKWLDIAVNFKTSRNVKLFCGEYGVYDLNCSETDRVYWYDVVRKYLEEKGIPWTTWDYQGGFGLFKKGSNELFDYDLNTDLLTSLNYTIPPQKLYVLTPDNKPFDIYSDYIGQFINDASYANGGTIDYYNGTAKAGNYSLYWTGCPRYSGPAVTFRPEKDLSILVANNYELDFWIKGDTPGTKFQIRFVDSKSTDPTDHPWRNSFDIDASKVNWNNTWQQVKIPLKSFQETGSWDNAWYPPVGKFDWKAVDRLEIVAEFNDLGTQKIWFDDLKVTGAPITTQNINSIPVDFKAKAYPNPFNKEVNIQFELQAESFVTIDVFDMSGRKVARLLNKVVLPGMNLAVWRPESEGHLATKEGIYFCRITTTEKTAVLKLMVKSD